TRYGWVRAIISALRPQSGNFRFLLLDLPLCSFARSVRDHFLVTSRFPARHSSPALPTVRISFRSSSSTRSRNFVLHTTSRLRRHLHSLALRSAFTSQLRFCSLRSNAPS